MDGGVNLIGLIDESKKKVTDTHAFSIYWARAIII